MLCRRKYRDAKEAAIVHAAQVRAANPRYYRLRKKRIANGLRPSIGRSFTQIILTLPPHVPGSIAYQFLRRF